MKLNNSTFSEDDLSLPIYCAQKSGGGVNGDPAPQRCYSTSTGKSALYTLS